LAYTILNRDDLPHDGNTYDFEGSRYNDTDVSFIWVDMPPAGSIRLHQHPYAEVFIIQEGTATFTIGSATVQAQAGLIVIVPAGTPHKFVNSGEQRLKQIDLHLSKQIKTEWLED
jgi:mannose-6-phosphate isomerase-like protein (cupin superfamily)